MGKGVRFPKIPPRRPKRPRLWLWVALAAVLASAALVVAWNNASFSHLSNLITTLPASTRKPAPGRLVSDDVVGNFTVQDVLALSKQDYGAAAPAPKYPVTEQLIRYDSMTPDGQVIEIYARVYLPRLAPGQQVPALAFAPGTTGIGDPCAASLEDPAKANWANYQSHMMTYAGQGYATVITDYEGMRDPTRLHHYMVGELEGRAVLDSVRALYSLPGYKQVDKNQLFLAGYSQGGQAAFWADQIAHSYAPELKIKGVTAFAPVSDITRSLRDITKGSTLTWFGPFVFTSYHDYYGHDYPLDQILQAKWIPTLTTDVTSHCINTVNKYWPTTPSAVYTPQFLAALTNDSLVSAGFGTLASDMATNAIDDQTTTPKLINQGDKDNVILPDQSRDFLTTLCSISTGPAKLTEYPNATHYNVMVQSFKDTDGWMQGIIDGHPTPTGCP